MRAVGMSRVVSVLALSAILPLSAGCFGSFPLVKKVYSFNHEVSPDKWMREGVFLLLNIPFVPVYSLSAAVDALFLNSVEFWTGEQLLADDTTREVRGERGEVVSARFRTDGTVELTIVEPDGTAHALTLVPDGDTLAAVDARGEELARVGWVGDELQLIDAGR